MQNHRITTMLKRKSVERDQHRSRNSQSVLRSPHSEHVFLRVEVDLYPAEYSPTCEPERLHDIVEWICSSGTHIYKRALMRFTSRGIVFEEQMVDFCEQIASSTLYKIKNVKGLWVDPTFRSYIAIVVRCSRSSLMIFVVRIVSGSMAKIVESFHAMKKYTNGFSHQGKQQSDCSVDRRDRRKGTTTRSSRPSRPYSNGSTDRNSNHVGRFRRYRSSSIDVRLKHKMAPTGRGRQSRSREKNVVLPNRRYFTSSEENISRKNNDESSLSEVENSDNSIKSPPMHEEYNFCNGHKSNSEESSQHSNASRNAGTQSVPPTSKKALKEQGELSNENINTVSTTTRTISRQVGVQYEELKTDQTADDLINKSEDYSSINSHFRASSDSSSAANTKEGGGGVKSRKNDPGNQLRKLDSIQSGDSNQEQQHANPPIDALFRELHVVREQLEQLKAPEQGRLRWFETDMEQMKNELRHIRAKLDDCVITYKNNDNQSSNGHMAAKPAGETYLQRVVKVKRADKFSDIPGDITAENSMVDNRYLRKSGKNCNIRPKNAECSSPVSAEYENVNYLKRLGNLPGYATEATPKNNFGVKTGVPQYTFTQVKGSNGDVTVEALQDSFVDRYQPPLPIVNNGGNTGLENCRIPIRLSMTTSRDMDSHASKPSAAEQNQPTNIPFMTPFFANQLTNPMFTNDRRLLINTLANQFGLPLDSQELADIVNDQSRYLTGRRTFANIIWNMTAEEEAVLRTKSPSPPLQDRPIVSTHVRRLELLSNGGKAFGSKSKLGENGILSRGKRKANKSVSFCLATG